MYGFLQPAPRKGQVLEGLTASARMDVCVEVDSDRFMQSFIETLKK